MSVVPFSKVTLCFDAKQKNEVVDYLQDLGCLHIISLKQDYNRFKERPLPSDAEQITKAIKYLEGAPHHRKPVTNFDAFDTCEITEQILENLKSRSRTQERLDFLKNRIADVSVWGDFAFPKLSDIGNMRFWFYQLPINKVGQIDKDLIVHEISRDNRFVLLVVLSEEEPAPDAMPVRRTQIGYTPLHELRAEYDDLLIKMEDLADERHFLTKYLYLLKANIARYQDVADKDATIDQGLDDGEIGLLQAWAPKEALPKLADIHSHYECGIIVEEPADDEMPPTVLDNPKRLKGAEILLGFYKTPSYRSSDPSKMIFFSFALFFAMIIADAGYGIVLLLMTLWKWRKMEASPAMLSLRPLFVMLSFSTIIFGLMVGSIFGFWFDQTSPLFALKILDLNDFNVMMAISVGIGCSHIIFANMLNIIAQPSIQEKMKPLGWNLVVVAGMLYALTQLSPDYNALLMPSYVLAAIGFASVLLFGNNTKVIDAKSAAKRAVFGLLALTDITKLFGDILSYMRLFALGLSGSSLSLTFNQLAGQVYEAVDGGGLLLAILIVIFGHTLNFGLCLMSGVVHGLRLNFIEFLNWGGVEEGKPYAPFKRQEVKS